MFAMKLRPLLRGFFVIFAVLSSLMLTAVAAHAANEKQASDYAATIGTQVLDILSANLPDAQKQTRLEALFVKIVDTDWIARFVIGASWRKMNTAQQAEYLDAYRKFLVRHYTSNFREYANNTSFKVTRSRLIAGNNQYLVSVVVNRPAEAPVNIDYRVRSDDNLFRVIDIVVEGVSLLATQRSEFSSVIQREGVERLIELLQKKSV